MRTINKDFIGVIKEKENGLLKYEEIDIPYPKELIEGIEAICQRDDTTIMDVQELYWKYFPNEENQKGINYLYPYKYDDRTIRSAEMPSFYNRKEFPFHLSNFGSFSFIITTNKYHISPCGFISKEEYEKGLDIWALKCAIKEYNNKHQHHEKKLVFQQWLINLLLEKTSLIKDENKKPIEIDSIIDAIERYLKENNFKSIDNYKMELDVEYLKDAIEKYEQQLYLEDKRNFEKIRKLKEDNKFDELRECKEINNFYIEIKDHFNTLYIKEKEIVNKEINNLFIDKKHELKLDLRDSFAEGTKRYVFAKYYKETKEKISESVLMLSTDTRGRTTNEYNIATDERIEIHTNYGYGFKSYHYCNLFYKGIPVLPYTDVLYYYSVQWAQVINYTKNYEPDREICWEQTFQFVEYISNLIKSDPKRFINEYLVGEIRTMINRLEEYVENPCLCSKDSLRYIDDESKKMYTYFNNIEMDNIAEFFKVATHVLEIRKYLFPDMNDSEKSNLENDIQEIEWYDDALEEIICVKNCGMSKAEYAVLPKEKDITITFEKVTGCLSFIENLRQLANHLPEIQRCIERLIKLNEKVLIKISLQKDNLSQEQQKDNDTIQKFEAILDKLREKKSELEENNIKLSLNQMRKKLEKNKEDCRQLTFLIRCLWIKNKQMKNIFELRNNLLKRYENYIERIESFLSKD